MADPQKLPSNVITQVAMAAGKGAIGAVPIAGPALAEALGLAVGIPAARRQERFHADVLQKLEALESKDPIDWERLRSDESFSATVASITDAVSRTANDEKLSALANAMVNSSKLGAPEEAIRHRFVRLVDELSDWHIKLMRFFGEPAAFLPKPDPTARAQAVLNSLPQAVQIAFPDLANDRELVQLMVRDLQNDGLLPQFSYGGMMTPGGVIASRTCPLGERFLAFIAEP